MQTDEPDIPKKTQDRHTIKSLRLDLKEALAGRTWLLLPLGFRAQECGQTYPLPSRRNELCKIAAIDTPPAYDKRDSGCIYIRRASVAYKESQRRVNSAVLDVGRRTLSIADKERNLNFYVKEQRAKARQAVEEVREEAVKQIASLSDLFSLGRTGIDGQMKAHIEGVEWQGEAINARAFRECFRMVTQAVKGLGLPSDQRKPASDAVMDECIAALKATQETISLAPSGEYDALQETKN